MSDARMVKIIEKSVINYNLTLTFLAFQSATLHCEEGGGKHYKMYPKH